MTAFLVQPPANCPSEGSRGPVIHSGTVRVFLWPLLQGRVPTIEVALQWGWGLSRASPGLPREDPVLVPAVRCGSVPVWRLWPCVVTLCSSLPQPWPLKLGFSSPYEGVLVCTLSTGPPCMSPGAVHAGFPSYPWSRGVDRACPNLPEVHAGGGPLPADHLH